MFVKIISIENQNEKSIVTFLCPYGEGRAVWNGLVPLIHQQYDIEFDIKDTLVWNKNVNVSPKKEFSIQMIGSTLELVGKVYCIDKSNCALKLGESIVLLNLENIPVSNDDYLRLACESVEIYNTNI